MSERWRIFVVEEEEKLNRNIVNSLRKDGYIVNGATNGNAALRILWAEEYDVVICDLKTSGIDGFEVLRWSRAYRPNTRVILVGELGNAVRTQALEAGAVSYLEKPLDLHLLKEELRRLLVQTGFSASLDSFDLLDVIQIISTSRKSIALLVSTGLEERGMLCFQGGSLVWAEYGMLRGEEAFFALAAHKNGTVVHQPWNEQVTPNVMQPLSRLILQAFQYRTKYAQGQQQFSGEQEAILAASAGVDDDSPFLVLTEHMEHMGNTGQQDVAQQAPVPVLQEQGDGGGDMVNEANGDTREWWEQTGKLAKRNTGSDSVRSVPVTPFLGTLLNGSDGTQGTPSAGHKKQDSDDSSDKLSNHDDLPSWLTDQPTATQLPSIQPSSLSESTQTPKIPSTPRLKSTSGEWQPPLRQQSTQQQPQRLQRPLRAQRIVEQTQETLAIDTRTHRTSPEWQSEELTTSRKTSDALSLEEVQENEQSSQNLRMSYPVALTGGQLAVKPGSWDYNYTALVSALQTLSYTISGFIAAAVVSLDGEPVAQVAVEDLDITRICKNLSLLLKSVLQSLEEEAWGEYQDTVITSADRRMFMRIVDREKSVFQMLITTREADPADCVAVMANVGEAIVAALRY